MPRRDLAADGLETATENSVTQPLKEVVREGARRILQTAMEAEEDCSRSHRIATPEADQGG